MTVCVFVGPTLRRAEVAAVLGSDVVCLPPVAQGDVYQAARRKPRAIGIVDGFFCGAPSVWHKEILWALSQGIPVFGSASMGALRAAELHSYGMRGVGSIFEGFRDGILEDDDEVAVVHGPAETGFVAVSEAMVNVRATLARAEADGVLGEPSRKHLEDFAKSLHFPERGWPAILEGARAAGLPESEIEALRTWLPRGRIDRKREDALAMLAEMRGFLAGPEPARPGFRFEWTHFWDDLFRRSMIEPPSGEGSAPLPARQIVEELKLEGTEAYERVRLRALLRMLAGTEAARQGLTAAPEAARAALSRLRAALGLYTRAELDRWMARNHLDAASLERLIEDQARIDAFTDLASASLEPILLDELRLSGAYERLVERARNKIAFLAARGIDGEEGGPPGDDTPALRLWFFERRLGLPMPDDVARFARELGFQNLSDFDRAVRRELLYSNIQNP
jgi:hypothetical protein